MSRTADFTTVTCPWCRRQLRARKPGPWALGIVPEGLAARVLLPWHKIKSRGTECPGTRAKIMVTETGEMVRMGDYSKGQLVLVWGRVEEMRSDGAYVVHVPHGADNAMLLRLEPGDLETPGDPGTGKQAQLPDLRGHSEVLLRVRLRSVALDGSHYVLLPNQQTITVGRGDLVTALDVAKAPLGAPPSWERTRQIMTYQDDLIYAMSRNLPLPTKALQSLPPWRTLFWAELAEKVQDARGDDAENCLEDGHMDALRMECQNAADEMRYPRKWWS